MVWWVLSVLCVLSVWRRGPKSPRELYKGFHFRRIKVCRRFSQFIPLASFTINFSHLVSSPQSVNRQLCVFALTLKQKQGAIDRFQFLMWNDQSSPRMPGGYGDSRWRCGGRCWWWRWHIGPKWSLYAGPWWWQLVTMMTLTIVGSRRGGPVTDMRVSSGHSIQHSIHLNQDLEKEKVPALIQLLQKQHTRVKVKLRQKQS